MWRGFWIQGWLWGSDGPTRKSSFSQEFNRDRFMLVKSIQHKDFEESLGPSLWLIV